MPAVFVDRAQQSECAAVLLSVHDKVIRSDVIRLGGSESNAGTVGQTEPGTFELCLQPVRVLGAILYIGGWMYKRVDSLEESAG